MSTSAARHARARRRPVPRPRRRDQHDHLLLVTHHYEPETGAPQRRWGTPEDLAAAVVFLAARESAFVTGQILVVDGGMTASM